MKKVLVTGGAGFVGSHTCKFLAQKGYTPIVYDNLCAGHKSAVKWGPFEEGDIRDSERLTQVIRQHRPSAIVHFAAFLDVGESVREPGKYYDNNVTGTISLLNVAKDLDIKKIVFSSSAATFGVPSIVPIPSDHAQNPINPYGRSKLLVEKILQEFDHAYGFKSVSLRYFNAAGADPDGEIGESHDPEIHVIPLAIFTALGRQSYFRVNGGDWPTPDGSCVRDFVHVTDLAQAHWQALEALEKGASTAAYNLGNGQGFSVLEVAAAVKRITQKNFDVRIMDRRPGDPPTLVADASAARKHLGWKPGFSDLDTIIETAYSWLKR